MSGQTSPFTSHQCHSGVEQFSAARAAPSHPEPWQPKGATHACTGECHSNLNRQTRNEFHHQRLASKLNSISLSEKHRKGKCLHHTPESCSCPQCPSNTSFLSPTEPRDRACQMLWPSRSLEETMHCQCSH